MTSLAPARLAALGEGLAQILSHFNPPAPPAQQQTPYDPAAVLAPRHADSLECEDEPYDPEAPLIREMSTLNNQPGVSPPPPWVDTWQLDAKYDFSSRHMRPRQTQPRGGSSQRGMLSVAQRHRPQSHRPSPYHRPYHRQHTVGRNYASRAEHTSNQRSHHHRGSSQTGHSLGYTNRRGGGGGGGRDRFPQHRERGQGRADIRHHRGRPSGHRYQPSHHRGRNNNTGQLPLLRTEDMALLQSIVAVLNGWDLELHSARLLSPGTTWLRPQTPTSPRPRIPKKKPSLGAEESKNHMCSQLRGWAEDLGQSFGRLRKSPRFQGRKGGEALREIKARCDPWATFLPKPHPASPTNVCRGTTKLRDLLSATKTYDFIQKIKQKQTGGLRCVNLCGGPGGFEQAMAEQYGCTVQMVGTTLDKASARGSVMSYAKLYQVARCRPTLLQTFAEFSADSSHATTDLLQDATQQALREFVLLSFAPAPGAHLVLADGGIHVDDEKLDQGQLELAHGPLLAAQLRAALGCLAPGGRLLIKVFGGCEPSTQHLIMLAATCFTSMAPCKPQASRGSSWEFYLMLDGFLVAASQAADAALQSILAGYQTDNKASVWPPTHLLGQVNRLVLPDLQRRTSKCLQSFACIKLRHQLWHMVRLVEEAAGVPSALAPRPRQLSQPLLRSALQAVRTARQYRPGWHEETQGDWERATHASNAGHPGQQPLASSSGTSVCASVRAWQKATNPAAHERGWLPTWLAFARVAWSWKTAVGQPLTTKASPSQDRYDWPPSPQTHADLGLLVHDACHGLSWHPVHRWGLERHDATDTPALGDAQLQSDYWRAVVPVGCILVVVIDVNKGQHTAAEDKAPIDTDVQMVLLDVWWCDFEPRVGSCWNTQQRLDFARRVLVPHVGKMALHVQLARLHSPQTHLAPGRIYVAQRHKSAAALR